MNLETIKELRARTLLGMTECKKALEQSGGNIEAAIELLQKQGLKNVDDLILPLEGQVRAAVEGARGVIVEVVCQTDFAAKGELFNNFLNFLTHSLLNGKNKDSTEVAEALNMLQIQLKEKIVITKIDSIVDVHGVLLAYNHGGKVAVLLNASPPSANREGLENVAMQIAAMKPLAITVDKLPEELNLKKIALFAEESKSKPEKIRTKIAEGKLAKWYGEVILTWQQAIFETEKKITIGEYLQNVGEIKRFVRFERGG